MKLSEILSPHLTGLLAGAGIHTTDDVANIGPMPIVALQKIDGIGPKTAEDIYAAAAGSGVEFIPPADANPAETPPPDEPTIDQAVSAAEVDQEALERIAPTIAAAMTYRMFHPTARFADEWEVAKAAIRVSKAVLAELKKA